MAEGEQNKVSFQIDYLTRNARAFCRRTISWISNYRAIFYVCRKSGFKETQIEVSMNRNIRGKYRWLFMISLPIKSSLLVNVDHSSSTTIERWFDRETFRGKSCLKSLHSSEKFTFAVYGSSKVRCWRCALSVREMIRKDIFRRYFRHYWQIHSADDYWEIYIQEWGNCDYRYEMNTARQRFSFSFSKYRIKHRITE